MPIISSLDGEESQRHNIDQVEPFDNIVREKLWYIYYLDLKDGSLS